MRQTVFMTCLRHVLVQALRLDASPDVNLLSRLDALAGGWFNDLRTLTLACDVMHKRSKYTLCIVY